MSGQRTDPVTIAIVGVMLAGTVVMGWQEVRGSRTLDEQTVAPDFTVERVTGEMVTLSQLRGKVVLVDFWATWCGPCREEMPWLVKAVKAHEAEGVTMVALSMDDLDSQQQQVSSFLRAFPELEPYAAYGRNAQAEAYLVHGFPTLYVLDRQGRVVAAQSGQASETQLEVWIQEALKSPP